MELTSEVEKLRCDVGENICTISGANDFLLKFNTNQMCEIKSEQNFIEIYIDLDLKIVIEK